MTSKARITVAFAQTGVSSCFLQAGRLALSKTLSSLRNGQSVTAIVCTLVSKAFPVPLPYYNGHFYGHLTFSNAF